MTFYEIVYQRYFVTLLLIAYFLLMFTPYNIFVMAISGLLLYLFVLGSNEECSGNSWTFINQFFVFLVSIMLIGSTAYAYITHIPHEYNYVLDFDNDENISFVFDGTKENVYFYDKNTKTEIKKVGVTRGEIIILMNGDWEFEKSDKTEWYLQYEITSYEIIEKVGVNNVL